MYLLIPERTWRWDHSEQVQVRVLSVDRPQRGSKIGLQYAAHGARRTRRIVQTQTAAQIKSVVHNFALSHRTEHGPFDRTQDVVGHTLLELIQIAKNFGRWVEDEFIEALFQVLQPPPGCMKPFVNPRVHNRPNPLLAVDGADEIV